MVVFSILFCLYFALQASGNFWSFSSPDIILIISFHSLVVLHHMPSFHLFYMSFKHLTLWEISVQPYWLLNCHLSFLPERFICDYGYRWTFGSCPTLLNHFFSFGASCHWIISLFFEVFEVHLTLFDYPWTPKWHSNSLWMFLSIFISPTIFFFLVRIRSRVEVPLIASSTIWEIKLLPK